MDSGSLLLTGHTFESVSGRGGQHIYFGQSEGFTYVAEITNNPTPGAHRDAVLAKVRNDGSDVRIWQLTTKPGISSWFQILARPHDSLLRVAFASNEVGTTGVGCGVQLQRLGSRIYVDGTLDHDNCASVPHTEVCMDNETLAQAPLARTLLRRSVAGRARARAWKRSSY